MSTTKPRYVYLDMLRILAIMCVIFNHSGANGYFLFAHTDNFILQIISIAISSFCKIGVPMFFAISGALMLGKEESLKDLYLKRVVKYLIITIVFCLIRYTFDTHLQDNIFSWHEFFRKTNTGQIYTPYWFLYAYIGYLISLPVLRALVKALDTNMYYYIFLVYAFFIGVMGIVARSPIGSCVVSVALVSDAIIYPIIGYFIAHKLPAFWNSTKGLLYLLLMAVLGLFANVAMTFYDHHLFLDWGEASFTLFISFVVVFVFVITKYLFEHIKLNHVLATIITTLGSTSFGVYLLEGYIKHYFGFIQVYIAMVIPRVLASLIYLFCIFLIGSIITLILKKIPFIGKLLG